ncbi:MAG: thermonuclease family protein [Acidobacteria bacterium]|nr:thermonuclease family protein [Acidobacteriota bacterium]
MPAPRVLLVAAALAVTAAACRTGPPSPTGPPGQATVVHVVDGDTIDVRIAGRHERVRLLGIDTPETVDPRKPVQCFGHEASQRTKALLPVGTVVRLERDAEARDIYGRLLAYVRRVDGTFVNLALLEEGYAHTLSIAPNVAYAPTFAAAAHGAQTAGRGLWSACPAETGR